MAKSQHAHGYRTVKALLLEMRRKAGLTQRELAQKVRRGQPWVHKSEVGERRVDISEFFDWCVACGVDPESAFREFIRKRR